MLILLLNLFIPRVWSGALPWVNSTFTGILQLIWSCSMLNFSIRKIENHWKQTIKPILNNSLLYFNVPKFSKEFHGLPVPAFGIVWTWRIKCFSSFLSFLRVSMILHITRYCTLRKNPYQVHQVIPGLIKLSATRYWLEKPSQIIIHYPTVKLIW